MIYFISESQKKLLKLNILGEKVMVYYNLNKHTFSIQKGGLVVAHADYVRLSDVEFRVRKGGLDRVRREQTKNVHAFVIGTLLDLCDHPCNDIPDESDGIPVTYNPYKFDTFVIKNTSVPVSHANEVEMINGPNKIFLLS